jgi:hypothetical protein
MSDNKKYIGVTLIWKAATWKTKLWMVKVDRLSRVPKYQLLQSY